MILFSRTYSFVVALVISSHHPSVRPRKTSTHVYNIHFICTFSGGGNFCLPV